MADVDWNDSFNRTALHEAGHAVVAKFLGAATPQLRLTGTGRGDTDITYDFPQSTHRVIDFLTHCRGTIAAGGNVAVRVFVGDAEADQELADQVDSVRMDEERMKTFADDLARSTGQPAVHWIDEFRAEARELLEEDFVQRAVRAVAAAVFTATPNFMLNDEQIQNVIEASGTA